jgi:electron transfer flavoprotein alpha subunit
VKLVCLVKQVPRGDSISFDEETRSLRREGVPLELNELDRYALTQAVALRERAGGEVVAMTMGPPQAEEALREALTLGADRCIHLSDRAFALADTIGTSRALSMALTRETCDLVLCGRKTLDSETWQVPSEVAAYLGWPHLISVTALELEGEQIRVTRETDEGEEVLELPLPAVVSIARPAEAAPSESPPDGQIELVVAADLAPDVRRNDKRFGQTGSPTRVLAVRDVTPERAGLLAATPAEAAERILALLAERPPTSSEWEKPERLGESPGKSYDSWTVAELVNGRPARSALELLAKGRELAGKLGGRNVAVVVGREVGDATRELIRHGAETVYEVEDAALADYHPELWTAALRQVLERYRPHVFLIPASARGREYGPRVAGELELGMTGDCVNLGIDRAGRLIQTKPAYGGNIVSVIMGATTPQLATVRPRMFEPLEPRENAEGEAVRVPLEALPEPVAQVVERRTTSPAYELDEAAAVLGVGDVQEADVPELESLAHTLGAAVGATRAAAEAGLVPANRQIGLLGRPVAPRLYVAVNAPGDYEHLTGTVKASVIVAVHPDPGSAMLGAADVGLIGDWRELLPPLAQALSGQF